ncbi:MAG: CDP-diacylglycerol--glycerol-3-phosphate 3-phosphatidyltransferase [Propionibacteriaceae bacterium]|jgi:CDP-diacylglycerol--glycerol-3-phosphate 3-phosphatidyltransferase|nr:CDP-diacylglycerol--glycerol-3-phosphate 3-phosphatidyltransferase [Propionibacteriaceae bacterium]
MTQTQLPHSAIKHVPNVLTVIRLILVPVFLAILFVGPHEQNWRIGATVLFIVAVLTDLFDGKIARRYNVVSDFGKIWDPIADKAITGAAFIGLSILGELPWWVTVLILVREWGITWMRVVMLKYKVMAAAAGGKLKTFLQCVALSMFLLYLPAFPDWFGWIAWAIMFAAFALTVITGLMYVRDALRLKTQAQREQA